MSLSVSEYFATIKRKQLKSDNKANIYLFLLMLIIISSLVCFEQPSVFHEDSHVKSNLILGLCIMEM